jgi:hypothetical protein
LDEETRTEPWSAFVEGELRSSLDRNALNLGGQQPRGSVGDDDDADNHYEVNMEQIMKKFTNFNSQASSASSNQDEDEAEAEEDAAAVEEDKGEFDNDDDDQFKRADDDTAA